MRSSLARRGNRSPPASRSVRPGARDRSRRSGARSPRASISRLLLEPDFWDDMAAGRPAPAVHLSRLPPAIAVSDLWVARLTQNAEAHGNSYLHELTLAIAALDRNNHDLAREHTDASLALKPSWLGYRLAALLGGRCGDCHRALYEGVGGGRCPTGTRRRNCTIPHGDRSLG